MDIVEGPQLDEPVTPVELPDLREAAVHLHVVPVEDLPQVHPGEVGPHLLDDG
jgi:hypothetical protein